ncbi:MAG: trigger factor [Lactococcus raffinolactis]
MTASFEKTGVNNGTLTFTIGQDTIAKGLNIAFDKVKKNLNVPGFRKGKVSRTVFNKMYGEEALYEEALNAVLPESYEAAVAESGIDPVAQPKIDIKSMNKGEDWEITADVIVKPEVKLGDYKNLEVSVDVEKDVTDADVDAKIEAAQKNLAELVIKEDAAENGDTVVIDFEGKVDGVAFDGGTAQNHSLELGSGSFIPGYEEQLVGHKAGETVEVTVTFPEDYQAEDLAGKEAVFTTTIHEVKAKEVPELDDELAKDIDEEVETLAELKAKYKAQLTEEKEAQYTDAVETAAIEAAVANAEIVELPGEMVHDEVHRAMNEFLGNMQQLGISADMYYQLTGTSEEQLHTQFEGDADKRVRTNLVIEAVAAAENFETTQDEIDTEVAELAETYNMPKEQVEKLLPADMLKHDIAAKKAVEVITSTAVVK